jgi:hypothetical protein
MNAAFDGLPRRGKIARGPQGLRGDRLNRRQGVLDAVVPLVEEKPLVFLGLFPLRKISAGSGDGDRLSVVTFALEFDKTPCAQPSPASVELREPVFHVVPAVAPGIERIRDRVHTSAPDHRGETWTSRPLRHEGSASRSAIKTLFVLIVETDVIGERVAPCPHVGGHHREIKGALLPRELPAQALYFRDVMNRFRYIEKDRSAAL